MKSESRKSSNTNKSGNVHHDEVLTASENVMFEDNDFSVVS